MDGEESTDIEDVPIEDTELCVRYIGTGDTRTISHRDLAVDNVPVEPIEDDLVWTPGSVVLYADWERMAGTPEQAKEMLRKQAHEFTLVGPGSEDVGEEEFSIGGE